MSATSMDWGVLSAGGACESPGALIKMVPYYTPEASDAELYRDAETGRLKWHRAPQRSAPLEGETDSQFPPRVVDGIALQGIRPCVVLLRIMEHPTLKHQYQLTSLAQLIVNWRRMASDWGMLGRLRLQALEGQVRITIHAHQEMVDEDISTNELLEAIADGVMLENYPEHRRGPCCLLSGSTKPDDRFMSYIPPLTRF